MPQHTREHTLCTPWVIHSHRTLAVSSCVYDVDAKCVLRSLPSLLSSSSASPSQIHNDSSDVHKKPVVTCKRTRKSLEGVWSSNRFCANTGYEPNLADFSNYADPDHNPIDIPEKNQDFWCSDDVTMISDSARGTLNSEALSSRQKAAVSRVSSLLGHSSLGKLSASLCRVVLASKKLGQSWTENLLQQRFFSTVEREKRSRIDVKDRESSVVRLRTNQQVQIPCQVLDPQSRQSRHNIRREVVPKNVRSFHTFSKLKRLVRYLKGERQLDPSF